MRKLLRHRALYFTLIHCCSACRQAEGPDASPCGELAVGPSGGGHNSRPPPVRSSVSLCPCHLGKGVAVPHISCSRARCYLRLSFAALPAVSLISVPPNACFPAPTTVLASSVPQNAFSPAPLAVPSVCGGFTAVFSFAVLCVCVGISLRVSGCS